MTESFQLPLPPQGMIFPQPAQHVANITLAILTAAFVIYALLDWRKTKSPLVLLMLTGGAVAYLNEPIMDLLGLVWHPRPGQWVAVQTFGPIPVWGLGVYTILFGGMPAVLLKFARNGLTPAAYWKGLAIFMLFDVMVEWPAMAAGLYTYYGNPPFEVLGLPLYWLFINLPGPLLSVAVLLLAPHFFRGWRQILILVLPMSAYAAGSLAVGWPIFSALNAPNATPEIKALAALLTVALGSLAYYEISRALCSSPLCQCDVRHLESL